MRSIVALLTLPGGKGYFPFDLHRIISYALLPDTLAHTFLSTERMDVYGLEVVHTSEPKSGRR